MGNACCATSRPGDSSDVRKKQLLFAKSNQERIERTRDPIRDEQPGPPAQGLPAKGPSTKSNAFYAAQSDTEESAGEGAPVSLHILGGQAAGMF